MRLFISDWGPMPALEEDAYTAALGRLGKALRPSAVIIVSGHWQTRDDILISGNAQIIFDYYGFPKEAYEIQYPLRYDAALAQKVNTLITSAGMKSAIADRGIDHGAWVPLMRLFPTLDAPVLQLSLPADPARISALAQALAPLEQEGVLLIGAGALSHNLPLALSNPKDAAPEAWADVFSTWVITRITTGQHEELLQYRRLAPFAHKAAPTPEHFNPLFFGLGEQPQVVYQEIVHGNGLMLIVTSA